jgi:hypothetical protein
LVGRDRAKGDGDELIGGVELRHGGSGRLGRVREQKRERGGVELTARAQEGPSNVR